MTETCHTPFSNLLSSSLTPIPEFQSLICILDLQENSVTQISRETTVPFRFKLAYCGLFLFRLRIATAIHV